MSAAHGIEATCDAVIDKLRAELPAKVDAINSEMADAYPIESPHERVCFGPRSEAQFPYVSVSPDGFDEPLDASGRIHFRDRLRVVAWAQDGDEEALARRLTRYQRAVVEVVLHFRRPGDSYTDPVGGYGLQLESGEPGPTFDDPADPGGRFVSWTSATFRVQRQQDL